MASRLLASLCLLALLCTGTRAQVPADTTISGQTYALLAAEELFEKLRLAKAPIRLRDTAVTGPLHAPSYGLDTVRAALDFVGVLFLDEVTLSGVTFLGPVYCERCDFTAGLTLLGSQFQREFSLRESRSGKHLTLKQAAFAGRVDLSDSYFAEPSSFIEVRFDRDARFSRTHFGAAAYFEGARFAGQADFVDARFGGVASFKEAVWDESAAFEGARFDERALFWRVHFRDEANFASVRADGEVSFNEAAFAGPANFSDFTFAQAARFTDATFAQAAFAGSYFRKEADFSGVEARALRFGAFFNRSLDLRRAIVGTLDLRPGANADSTFARSARIYLEQSYFDRVLVRWAQLQNRLAASDSTSFDALEPAYASLRHHFLVQGLEHDAEDCQIERLERQRRILDWAQPKRWALELWHLSSHYGTDPQRLVLFILSFILVFGLVYRIGRTSMRPAYGEGEPTLADCISFSIYTFTHAGYRAWYVTGKLKLLASIEALLGWISLGLLLAVALAHLL